MKALDHALTMSQRRGEEEKEEEEGKRKRRGKKRKRKKDKENSTFFTLSSVNSPPQTVTLEDGEHTVTNSRKLDQEVGDGQRSLAR